MQCVSGIQSEGCKENNCYQIELKGSIWSSSELLALHARSALIHLLKKANSLGWELAVSADVSSKYYPNDHGPDYPEDVDSWYFIRRYAGQGKVMNSFFKCINSFIRIESASFKTFT